MVTTRGGTETPGVPTPTPRSSTRKTAGKRELESLDTPTQAKRVRKAAPASATKKKAGKQAQKNDASTEELSQESVDGASDTIAVASHSQKTPQTPEKAGSLPVRRRSSPKVVVAKTSPPPSTATESAENDFHTPMQAPGSVYATPATHIRPQGSPTPRAVKANNQTPAPAKKSKGRAKKTPQEDEPATLPDEIPSSTQETDDALTPTQNSIPTSAQPQKTHKRFGSEEPTETQESLVAFQPTQPPVETAQDDDDASDSDEAPEVVTTAAATSKTLAARAEAERAQKAQQAKESAKRQAREELLAAQQAAKREREEKKAKKLAKKAEKEKQQQLASIPESSPEPDQQMDIDRHNLPSLLPTSLLETLPDQRAPTPPPERRGKTEEERRKEKLNHHIKFLERTDKPAKDVKKGKVSVAVLAKGNKVLPPKMNRDTKNVREEWLKGRKVEKKKGGKRNFGFGKRVERRGFGNRGFLRDE